MEKKIRVPVQDRSKDKKNKIIESAYEIFSEVGFYNANTTDIAKRAGVSTGIVYGYFSDKHDILLYVIDIYISKISNPLQNYLTIIETPIDYRKVIEDFLNLAIELHKSNKNIHNILHSLATTDKDINEKFMVLEDNITIHVARQLALSGVIVDGLKEKVHVAMNSIQSFAHEYVYDKHDYIDYEKMREDVVRMLVNLFNQ